MAQYYQLAASLAWMAVSLDFESTPAPHLWVVLYRMRHWHQICKQHFIDINVEQIIVQQSIELRLHCCCGEACLSPISARVRCIGGLVQVAAYWSAHMCPGVLQLNMNMVLTAKP
jgi:hypothetical protein